MSKTILITGATDGIGFEAAKLFARDGHTVLVHGRSQTKVDATCAAIGGTSQPLLADLSRSADIVELIDTIKRDYKRIDVLINNAGVLKAADTITPEGLELRFMVNTIAPYMLTVGLLDLIPTEGRIINLSSAAQAPVNVAALQKGQHMGDMDAYAQSKLAITMWSRDLAARFPDGPGVLAVNPGSLLGSKMVKEGFGIAGNDLSIGAEILYRAALDPAFADTTGRYFDNDAGTFGQPHADALDTGKVSAVMQAIQSTISRLQAA